MIKSLELTQTQIKKLAVNLNAINLNGSENRSKGEQDRLTLIAYSIGKFGVNAKIWKGEKTGSFYVATNYSTAIYRYH